MAQYEQKEMGAPVLQEVEGQPSYQNKDDIYLARMGKRPVLQRNFGLMSMVGFSCTILITWEAVTTLFLQSFQNGGPAGSVYGYIFVWVGVTATFAVVSELVSMAPTSGGQYHWCSMMAPKSVMKVSSYITGWLTVIGWQATYATGLYLNGNFIEALVILTNPDYTPAPWRKTLYSWATAVFAASINIIGGKLLPRFEGTILILHILGFFAILIPLTYMAEHKPASEVFTYFINEGHWPTQGLSFFIGIIGPVFAFAGGDAAVHMVEEMTNATVAVPWSLMLTVLINGTLGFSMLIALYFCLGDIETSLKSPTGVPFLSIFYQATESTAGTAAAGSVIQAMCCCTTVGMLASASRQFWSFSRDRGIPGWRIWSKVTPRTAIPTYTVLLTSTIGCLLNLINIGSDVAFNSLVSMSTSGLYLSYMIAAGLLLYRRCTGEISEAKRNSEQTMVNTAGAKLVWGPFHLPGIWGIGVNIFSLVYMFIATFFSFWPPINDVNSESMNYSVVGTGGTVLLSLGYYLVRARGVYEGPVIEI
ncbi:amino acid/polyamine transporter I [Aspergillus pseudonomiae]|uniref:Amino acid/polyamine transporter I n=1 Tax=Aspergillus pseudonomiae TaxID=1506151 RepID=A0A5N7DL59_9EURO|nr:amino acid/polyamine transporter I [Aspergillus pseudonomiae]KAE8406218.1 amino acid/polyamine transporter I [Aspergillus pseudonomiae]